MKLSNEILEHIGTFLYPQVSIQEWLETIGADFPPIKCTCGKLLYPAIPIADKFDRGVIHDPCSCGLMPPASFIPVSRNEKDSSKLLFQELKRRIK